MCRRVGSAQVFGLDARRRRARIRQGVGYMPENDSFIGNMNGVRFVRYMAELAGLPPARSAGARARGAVLCRARRSALSQDQYLFAGHEAADQAGAGAGARAELLILDEPTNGLDPTARQRMIQLIKDIRKQGGTLC